MLPRGGHRSAELRFAHLEIEGITLVLSARLSYCKIILFWLQRSPQLQGLMIIAVAVSRPLLCLMTVGPRVSLLCFAFCLNCPHSFIYETQAFVLWPCRWPSTLKSSQYAFSHNSRRICPSFLPSLNVHWEAPLLSLKLLFSPAAHFCRHRHESSRTGSHLVAISLACIPWHWAPLHPHCSRTQPSALLQQAPWLELEASSVGCHGQHSYYS